MNIAPLDEWIDRPFSASLSAAGCAVRHSAASSLGGVPEPVAGLGGVPGPTSESGGVQSPNGASGRRPHLLIAPARRLKHLVDPALDADWMGLSLCFARERTTLPLARAARVFVRDRGWIEFGYVRIEDHAREQFGRSGRWVRDLASLAEAVEKLPELEEAITGDDGGPPIGRVVALAVGRVATSMTSAEWIALARSLPVREFRDRVRVARESASAPIAPDTSPRVSIAASADSLNAAAVSCSGVGDRFPFSGSDAADEATRAGFGPAPSDSAPSCATGSDSVAVDSTDDPETQERCTIRFALPAPVVAALDEARDLHGAICGGDTGLAPLIEALAAETLSGPCETLYDDDPRRRRCSREAREAYLARASENWEFLRRVSNPDQLLEEVRETLLDIDRLCDEAASNARDAEALVRALTHLEDEIEIRLGQVLAMMTDIGALKGLSFAGVGHYAEQRLGISRTTAEDRTRLARALRNLPIVRTAYEHGTIGFQAASLICRILAGGSAEPRMQAGWVRHAERTTIKRLRDEMRLTSRERVAQPNAMASSPADDTTWHRSLARRPGDAIARVAEYGLLSLEDRCRTVIIPMRLPADLAAEFLDALSTVRRSLENQAKGMDIENAISEITPEFAPGSAKLFASEPALEPPASLRAARAFSIRCGSVPDWVAMLAMIEDFVATWDDPQQSPERDADAIYIRDGWRCSAPGCTSRRNLEEHHVQYRSRGGTDEMSNRVCLCRFHHQRGEHGDLLKCQGEAPVGLIWHMGRYGKGGGYMNERRGRGRRRPASRRLAEWTPCCETSA